MGPDAKPKYLNSPESEMYRKSNTLYGIDRSRGPIARGGRAVVCEGYTDVLALHQAGVEEAVAVMGTAITPDQLKMLGSYAEEVVLALDADRAGREAMLRAQRVTGSGRLRLMVAAMPQGEDPADLLLDEASGAELRRALAAPVDLAVFHARAILGDADLSTPTGRDRALDEVVPVLVGMGETITRQEMVREVADRLDADPDLVVGRLKRGAASPPPAAPAATEEQRPAPQPRRRPATPQEEREYKMLALCIENAKLGAPFMERLREDHFTSPVLAKAFGWLREHLDDPLDGLGEDDPQLYNAIVRLRAVANEPATEQDLEFRWRLLERDRMHRELRRAESQGDAQRAVELQREMGQLNDAIAGARR